MYYYHLVCEFPYEGYDEYILISEREYIDAQLNAFVGLAIENVRTPKSRTWADVFHKVAQWLIANKGFVKLEFSGRFDADHSVKLPERDNTDVTRLKEVLDENFTKTG